MSEIFINNDRHVIVDVYRKPDGCDPDISANLLKAGNTFPTFDSFENVIPKQLSKSRQAGVENYVYSVLRRNRIYMSQEALKWWEEDINWPDLQLKEVIPH